MKISSKVEKGQEVRIVYNPKGNTLLMRQYGFSITENPQNIVAINVTLDFTDPHIVYKHYILDQIGLNTAYPNSYDTLYGTKSSIGGGVFSLLRLKYLNPTPHQLENLIIPDVDTIISVENEKKVIKDLQQVIEASLARYKLPELSGDETFQEKNGIQAAKEEYEIWRRLKLFAQRAEKPKVEL